MEAATEYRDTWRGLRMQVPAGWRVRRAGRGVFVHDEAGAQTVVVQPRLAARTVEGLECDLSAWLRRFDPQAELQPAERAADGAARLFTVTTHTCAGEDAVGIMALQAGEQGGLISGFLAPASSYEAASRTAVAVLSTLAAYPTLARQAWREPAEGACTALVPEGWQVEARLDRAKPTGLPAIHFQAWADAATGAWATAEGRLYAEPGLLGGLLGRLAGGLVGQARFVDAAAYAEGHLLAAVRTEAPGARLEAVVERPDLLPQGIAAEAASSGVSLKDVLQGQPSAVEAIFSYRRDGRQIQHVARVLTMRAPASLAHGMPLWMAMTPQAYRAPADGLAEWEPALEGVCASFQVTPEWRNQQQAQVAAQIGRHLSPQTPATGAAALLGEAESLVCTWAGRPLAIHERPFIADGEAADSGAAMAALYDAAVWRT